MAKRTSNPASSSQGHRSSPGAAPVLSPTLPVAEYQRRRDEVQRALGGAVGLVFAGEGADPRFGVWMPDPMFFYLTGISSEQSAAVLFDASHEDPLRRIILFLRPLNPEADRWDAFRDTVSGELRNKFGFGTILRTGHLPDTVTQAVRRARKAACLHPFGNFNAPVSQDLTTFRKVQERIPGIALEDRTEILRQMRSRKSDAELALMRRAIAITAEGLAAALRVLKPGAGETAVMHAIENEYRRLGACGPAGPSQGITAYNTIAGSGVRGTLLHYRANDGPTDAGELMVIDTGAQCGGYAADITRTYPVSGKFDSTNRDIYELVLEAQLASIKAAKPGATMTDVLSGSRELFDKRGMLDHFWHGIGHHLGLQVHDTDPGTPLQPGHVITIEPGLYMPDRGIGVRIEDDILITRGGNENLSAAIPKSVKEIEAAMAGS